MHGKVEKIGIESMMVSPDNPLSDGQGSVDIFSTKNIPI